MRTEITERTQRKRSAMSFVDDLPIFEKIAEVLRLPVARVTAGTALTDLVTDSFVLVELVVELQESFGVFFVQEDLKSLATVGDVAALVKSRVPAGRAGVA